MKGDLEFSERFPLSKSQFPNPSLFTILVTARTKIVNLVVLGWMLDWGKGGVGGEISEIIVANSCPRMQVFVET